MKEREEENFVTPGEVLGKSSELKPGKGAYVSAHDNNVYSSLTGFRSISCPATDSDDPRPTVEVSGHKAQGPVTKVMAKMASADIICVGPKSVREKFTGIIRQQDVRATEIDKLSLGDARAYYLSTAKNELGVVSAESVAGTTMIPISWTEMQCPSTGQIELRKVAKIGPS
ncbi:exosome complex component CSL4 [Striga asiatica]|uniref:Exosome complex component CSL4 n=1 Tax=Striga asiatica TaxID=4170 RepID=A0A5A7R1S8_STRAF|nr:exosome complex component CSL4 [Striga asiatica]